MHGYNPGLRSPPEARGLECVAFRRMPHYELLCTSRFLAALACSRGSCCLTMQGFPLRHDIHGLGSTRYQRNRIAAFSRRGLEIPMFE